MLHICRSQCTLQRATVSLSLLTCEDAGQKMCWRAWGFSGVRADSRAGVSSSLWMRGGHAEDAVAQGYKCDCMRKVASTNTTQHGPRMNSFGHVLEEYLGKVSGLIRLAWKSGRRHIHMCLLLYNAEVSYWCYLCVWKTCWKLSYRSIQIPSLSMYVEVQTLQVELSFACLGVH